MLKKKYNVQRIGYTTIVGTIRTKTEAEAVEMVRERYGVGYCITRVRGSGGMKPVCSRAGFHSAEIPKSDT